MILETKNTNWKMLERIEEMSRWMHIAKCRKPFKYTSNTNASVRTSAAVLPPKVYLPLSWSSWLEGSWCLAIPMHSSGSRTFLSACSQHWHLAKYFNISIFHCDYVIVTKGISANCASVNFWCLANWKKSWVFNFSWLNQTYRNFEPFC